MSEKAIHVLLVEDNPGDARLIRELLTEARENRFTLECADRLGSGLERLAAGGIDAVLLDLTLPDSQGFDTFAEAHSRASEVPMLILTGLDDEEVAVRAVREGADDYLVKGDMTGGLLPRALRYAIERKKIQEALRGSEEKFRAVAETANDAIVSTDSRGNITYFNKAAERMFGYSVTDMVGKPFASLIPERFHDRQGIERFLPTGESSVIGKMVELAGRKSDGSEFPLELSVASWNSKGGTFFTGIIRDITERKHAEEELKESHENLEKLVGERTAELVAANKELEAFTYTVAHDLRAPLRHIDGFSKILQEEVGPSLELQGQHCLRRIREGVQHMGRLVDDLLNLARVGRQSVTRRRVELGKLVRQVVAELESDTQGREIEWQIGELPPAECDPALIKLVFYNLLSNAVKYTRPQKYAIIQVGQMMVEGQPVIFVRDNGIGFNMRHVGKLFGIFQRLHRQEDFEGTGVGLANAQRIIHKHGGRVWAEAELDKGATFYFTLGGPELTESAVQTARGGEVCQQPR